jgi:hypothetical protein
MMISTITCVVDLWTCTTIKADKGLVKIYVAVVTIFAVQEEICAKTLARKRAMFCVLFARGCFMLMGVGTIKLALIMVN